MRSELEEKVRNEYDEYTKRVLAGDKIAYDKFLADSTFLLLNIWTKLMKSKILKMWREKRFSFGFQIYKEFNQMVCKEG